MNRVIAAAAALVFSTCSVAAFAANRSDPEFVRPNPGINVPAGGGSCATPVSISSLPFSQAGNTCGGTNNISDYSGPVCSGDLPFPYPGPEDIWAITVGTGNSLNISANLGGSTGDLVVFVLSACGDGASCFAHSQDAIGPGAGPETVPTISGLTPGTYYIYIDSYYGSGSASCGTYTLAVTGTLPVSLESFRID